MLRIEDYFCYLTHANKMFVIDASFAIEASLSESGLDRLKDCQAVAPPLMWSEATSVLHEMQWRTVISRELAQQAYQRLMHAPIGLRHTSILLETTWRIADGFGWAKTYDAEYVALAQLLHCPLLTLDSKLAKTAARVIRIVDLTDL